MIKEYLEGLGIEEGMVVSKITTNTGKEFTVTRISNEMVSRFNIDVKKLYAAGFDNSKDGIQCWKNVFRTPKPYTNYNETQGKTTVSQNNPKNDLLEIKKMMFIELMGHLRKGIEFKDAIDDVINSYEEINKINFNQDLTIKREEQ